MRKLIVILKHKFTSIDTITPILLEYSKKNSDKIILFFPNKNDIVQLKKNFVLYKILNKISSIKLLGHENYFLRKFIKFYYLLFFIFSATKKDKFIHFGELDNWPFAIISLINSRKTYFCESTLYYSEFDINLSKFSENHPYFVGIKNNNWLKVPHVRCKNIIAATEKSVIKLHPKHKSKKLFFYGPSRLNKSWLDYSKNYLNDLYGYYKNLNFTNGYIVMPLNTFEDNYFFKPGANLETFKEILNVLKDLPIPTLIKPHYYTQMDIVNTELNKINSKNLVLTYFHATVLALNSRFWICNCFSSTCMDAFSLGVPIVEYADYSNKLCAITKNSSMHKEFVDHFIMRDKRKLKLVINDLLNKKNKLQQRISFSDKNNLIKSLVENN